MKIQKGKYVLYADQWSWWINEVRICEKGKHQGETFEVRIAGYCTSIDKLISDFTERVIRSVDAEDLEGVLTALKDAQESCKALLTESKWIPCSERLPEENGHYLVTARWKTAGRDELIVASDDYFSYGWDDWDEVLAWMPLPKPWEGDK